MKKSTLTVISLLLILCLALAGCGRSDSSEAATAEPETEEVYDDYSEEEEVIEEEPMYTEGFSTMLTYAQPFSEGLAWVQYTDEGGTLQTAVMDTEGNIRFTLGESAEYLSSFRDGTAFYTVTGSATDVLIDAAGNEIYRTQGSENDTVKTERICGYANGIYILARQESGITANTCKVALMNPNGTMKLDYTNDLTSLDMYASAEDLINGLLYENTAAYRGQGWYQVGDRFINFDDMRIGRIAYHTIVSDFLPSGEIVAFDHVGMYRYDSNLGFVENYVSIFPREMQDGIFFRNAYNFDSQKYEAGYYNERLERVIAVDLYPDNQVYCSPFSGGLAVMEITGADGNMYITMIDAAGKQMFEPVVAEDYYPRVLDGYVIAKKDGELWLMDQTGSFVHNLTADFPECEVSVEMMHGGYSGSSTFGDDFSEGWFVLDYRYDGSSYRRFYPVVKAAEAGAEIYDLGVLTPAPVEAVTEYEEPEETVEKNYVRMDNFVIEGKWKSVGSYGFGQAQPGAIVIFNGNNCNFFSPQDTYAFYQDGDNYRLDTTSFLSTDTLSFTVKTIDADHIDVYYGDNVTELERVG